MPFDAEAHSLTRPSDYDKCECGTSKRTKSRQCRACADLRKRKTYERLNADGYMLSIVARRPACSTHSRNGTRAIPVHIEIAERLLGRPMKKGEIVHHINMDRADNRHCNLLICDLRYHAWLHKEYMLQFVNKHLTVAAPRQLPVAA